MIKVTIIMDGKAKSIEVDGQPTPEAIMRNMGLYLDAYLVLRGSTPLPIDEDLHDGDTIRIIKVASGG